MSADEIAPSRDLVPFSAVLPRLHLTREAQHTWTTPCPACSGVLDVDNSGYGTFEINCGNAECDRDTLAAALGVAAVDLFAFGNDVADVPCGPLDCGPIDWTSVRAEEDVDRARLVLRHIRERGHAISFTPEAGWLLWEGSTWDNVRTETLRTYAHEVAEHLYDAAEYERKQARALDKDAAKARDAKASRLEKSSRALRRSVHIDALLKELPALPGVLASILDYDTCHDVIGVGNGVVDLRTGVLRPYTSADKLTRKTVFDYDPAATAPRWERYLSEVFIGEDGTADGEYVAFIRRLIGYGITGHTREHILAVMYGRGANGKSVFVETVQHVFQQHTSTTPFETLEEKPTGSIPNDIAALRGSRLVMASEGGAGRPMNEAVIKRLTGGDTISARFMRKDFFEFVPAFLIMLATNHKPSFRGQDEGLWRRVKLLPFRAHFPVGQRDDSLKDTLCTTEAQGILAWAVRGAAEWYTNGLAVPQMIEDETAAFRTESDRLGEFIADCLSVTGERENTATLTEVFTTYRDWSEEVREERPFGRNLFGNMLSERPGITRVLVHKSPVYRGVKIGTPSQARARANAAKRADHHLGSVPADGGAPF